MTSALNLGYLASDFYFNGTLDEVIIYNRALTPTEVLELSNDLTATALVVEKKMPAPIMVTAIRMALLT